MSEVDPTGRSANSPKMPSLEAESNTVCTNKGVTISTNLNTTSKLPLASESSNAHTTNNTVALHSRTTIKTAQSGEELYSFYIDQQIIEKPYRINFIKLEENFELLNTINSVTINQRMARLGYNNLSEFFKYVALTLETEPNDQKLLLNIKDTLLELLALAKTTNKQLSYFCNIYINKILTALNNGENSLHFTAKQRHTFTRDIDTIEDSKKFFLFSGIIPLEHIDKIDFQNAINIIQKIKQEYAISCQEEEFYDKKQKKRIKNNPYSSYPNIYILKMLIESISKYIVANNYFITDVDLFNAIIKNLVSSLFKHNCQEIIINSMINSLFNSQNKSVLEIFVGTEKSFIYEQIKEILEHNLKTKDTELFGDKLRKLCLVHKFAIDARQLHSFLCDNYNYCLFTNLDKPIFYTVINLHHLLLKEKTEDATSSKYLASDKLISELAALKEILQKITKIDSLEKLSYDELFIFANRRVIYLNPHDAIEFIHNCFVSNHYHIENIKNILEMYADMVTFSYNIILGTCLKALMHRDSELLLNDIALFKKIAQTEDSEYKNIAWFMAGELGAHYLNNTKSKINTKQFFQDVMNSYLQAALLGNHRAYSKMANLVMQHQSNPIKAMQEASSYYNQALNLIKHTDGYFNIYYLANSELLDLEVAKILEEPQSQISKKAARANNKKQSKQKSTNKKKQADDSSISPQVLKPKSDTVTDVAGAEASPKVDLPVLDVAKAAFPAPKKYTPDDCKIFWEALNKFNGEVNNYEIESAATYLNSVIANPFNKHTSENWIKVMIEQNKIFFYYNQLQMSLEEDMDFKLLDIHIKPSTPREITEDYILQIINNLFFSGLRILSIQCSKIELLEKTMDVSDLSIKETRQLASLLSSMGHIYSYRASITKGKIHTKFIEHYGTLYNLADMINPTRLTMKN